MRTLVIALLFCCSGLLVAQRPGPPPGDPWAYGSGGPGNWDSSWNNRPPPRRGACFFTDAQFRGNRFCVRAGDRIPNLPGRFGNSISSIQTFGGARVQVFDGPGFRGASGRFANINDFSKVRGPGGRSWNDRISSVQVF